MCFLSTQPLSSKQTYHRSVPLPEDQRGEGSRGLTQQVKKQGSEPAQDKCHSKPERGCGVTSRIELSTSRGCVQELRAATLDRVPSGQVAPSCFPSPLPPLRENHMKIQNQASPTSPLSLCTVFRPTVQWIPRSLNSELALRPVSQLRAFLSFLVWGQSKLSSLLKFLLTGLGHETDKQEQITKFNTSLCVGTRIRERQTHTQERFRERGIEVRNLRGDAMLLGPSKGHCRTRRADV